MNSLTIGLIVFIFVIVVLTMLFGYSYFGSLKTSEATDISRYNERQSVFKDALAMSKISDFIYSVSDNRYHVIIDLVNNTVYVAKLRAGLIKAHTSVTLDLKTRKFVSEGTPDSSMLDLLDVAKGENMYDIYDSVFGISALWGIREDTAHTHTSLCTLTDGTAFSFDGEKLFRIFRGNYVVENIRY